MLHLAKKYSAILTLLAAVQAHGATYSYTDLGTLGGSQSWAYDVNDFGQVVGESLTLHDGPSHIMLWDAGTLVDLGPNGKANSINNAGQMAGLTFVIGQTNRATIWSGGTEIALPELAGTLASEGKAINNAGQVAGNTQVDPFHGHIRATLWNGSTATDLGSGSRTDSYALGLNSLGHVSGYTWSSDGIEHATVWKNGTISELDAIAGEDASFAYAINDAGLAVGYSHSVSGDVATVWDGTSVASLAALPGGHAVATDINNSNQIVGYSEFATSARATLWTGATTTDLNSFLDASVVSAGWVLRTASAINDRGWIVGDAYNSLSGETHAYMLSSTSPVPEPQTFTLMIAGFGIVGGALRSRLSANRRWTRRQFSMPTIVEA